MARAPTAGTVRGLLLKTIKARSPSPAGGPADTLTALFGRPPGKQLNPSYVVRSVPSVSIITGGRPAAINNKQ